MIKALLLVLCCVANDDEPLHNNKKIERSATQRDERREDRGGH